MKAKRDCGTVPTTASAMKRALLAASAALLVAAPARAADVRMVWRDVPLGGRALQSAAAPIRFDMLALHWQGAGAVAYRTRGVGGRWGPWRPADDDLPRTSPPWRFGDLAWTGASDRVQFRAAAGVTRLRAYYVWSGPSRVRTRTLSVAGSPPIVPRQSWEADEKIVRAHPLYAPALKLAIVHHTAGTNDYTPAEAAAIVRGIELYHVKGNGWNDIGYNFLVDRYGKVYEGRAGGTERNVVGAHALGFNNGTVGVALIGNFAAAKPPPAMEKALVSLLAWRLDVAHLDPLSTVAYTSGGNGKYRSGKVVTLRAISGHRDTGPTECPGNAAYADLGALARRVSRTGLPKLYAPVVSGALGGDVRFQARLSGPRRWTVTVADAAGRVVARRSGVSKLVDWTWRSAGLGKGPFAWTIAAGADVLPARGTLGRRLPPPPAPQPAPAPVPPPAAGGPQLVSGLSVSPSVLTPSTDGTGLVAAVDFTLAREAAVTVRVGGLQLLSTTAAAGRDHFEWDLGQLADGRYELVVTATAGGRTSTQSAAVVVDRTLSGLTASPASFSPNADGSADTISFGFSLARSVPVQVTVQRAGVTVATLFTGQLGPGPQTVGWDGTAAGARLPDGQYTAVVTATDPLATVSLLVPFAIDTAPPALALVDGATLRFSLGEPATVTALVDGQTVVATAPAGVFAVPWTGPPATAWSVSAKDAAGNPSATLSGP